MENLDFLNNYNGATEIQDNRDYTIEELAETGGNVVLPKKFFLQNVENLNQGHIGACTVFGSVNAFNETIKNLKISNTRIWEIWNEAKKRGASDITGWFFQSALQLLKDLGEIKGYVRLDLAGFANLDKIKKAIVSGKAVVTGTAFGNWAEIIKSHEYKPTKNRSGHIFDIVGYDDDYKFADGSVGGLFVQNSWGKNGYFWLKYSDMENLYSQYIFEDVEEIRKKRRTKNLEKAFDKKIWNEERPNDKATSTEIRIMINRSLGLVEDYRFFRKHFTILLEDKVIKGKFQLWNEENPYNLATDEEVAIMFSRAVMRANVNELGLSREQVAEVIGRDFL